MIQGTWLMQGEDLSVPMEIRKKVFVEEQHVDPAHEQDAFDAQAMHVVMWDVNPKTDEKRPVGTGRIYYGDEGFMMGRICVLPEYRGPVSYTHLHGRLRKASERACRCHQARKSHGSAALCCGLNRRLPGSGGQKLSLIHIFLAIM